MNRLSRLGIFAIKLCSILVALTVLSKALAVADNRGPNAHVRTLVKRSIASSSCYCCLATYDSSCCHACTSHWDAPIPFYIPEKKRDGSGSGSGSGSSSSSEVAPLIDDLQASPRASVADLSLVSCACCQASQSKSCCEMCKITTGLSVDAALLQNSLTSDTTGLVRKRGFNLGNSYSTCMCCTLTRWRGCCYRCPYSN